MVSEGTCALKRCLVLKRQAHQRETLAKAWYLTVARLFSKLLNTVFATRCASQLRNTRNEKGWKNESADLRVLAHTKLQEFPGRGVGRRLPSRGHARSKGGDPTRQVRSS